MINGFTLHDTTTAPTAAFKAAGYDNRAVSTCSFSPRPS
jgi:hypothetical protein